MGEWSNVFVHFFVELSFIELSKAFISYQSMSMTTVPEPLSLGLMIISSRRIRCFRACLSCFVRLTRILFGLVLRSCSSMVLQNTSNGASCVGLGVQVHLTRKGLWPM